MTIEQTALAFAREVLGWEDARLCGEIFVEQHYREGPSKSLYFIHMDSVLEAVTEWCRKQTRYKRSVGVCLTYGGSKRRWHASVKRGAQRWHHTCDDPCEAFLLACLEAARRLRGGESC